MTSPVVAALFDIHANLPALQATLDDVERAGADVVVIGGDVVFGPMPGATLDRLAELGGRARFVRGNTDRLVADAYESWGAGRLPRGDGPEPLPVPAWAAKRLTPAHRERLARLEPTITLAVPGLGDVLFCHATPRSDEEIVTLRTPDPRVAAALAEASAPLVVAGHTHVQFDRVVGERRLVNAGSVGMPFEDEPGAYWALLADGEVSLRRTAYDHERAGASILATGYPEAEELVRESLLEPIGRDRAAALFEELGAANGEPFAFP